MKVLSKIAVCGLLSLTLSSAANAQSAAVTQKAVQAMQQSATAKQFLQNRLGLRPGASAADVNAALARLGSAERAVAVGAINAFSTKAVITGDSSAISANEALAKTIFSTSNGQLIDLAKSGPTASRDAVVAGETTRQLRNENGQFCSKSDYANRVSADTKVSQGEALTLLEGGYIRMGTCGVAEGGLLGYSADARETLLLAAIDVAKEYGFRPVSSLNASELARLDQVWAQGLASAKNRNGGTKFTVASELITAQKIKSDCSLRN